MNVTQNLSSKPFYLYLSFPPFGYFCPNRKTQSLQKKLQVYRKGKFALLFLIIRLQEQDLIIAVKVYLVLKMSIGFSLIHY